jgi:hypothetical protein
MEYNTTKSKLINGEYGRHIQKMIEYAVDIRDRNLRTQQANAIVRAMSFFTAGTKDTEDYWHKLWDHLFIISDYKLDVDAPFPMPDRKIVKERVKALKYPKHEIRFRPYGYLIENIINKMVTEDNCPDKEQAVVNVANHLKKQYLNWNRDSVNDELIEEHLKDLSHGGLELKENFRFSSTQAILEEISNSVSSNPSPKGNPKSKVKNNASGNINGNLNGNVSGNVNPNANINANGKKKKKKKKNNPNNPNNPNNTNNPNNSNSTNNPSPNNTNNPNNPNSTNNPNNSNSTNNPNNTNNPKNYKIK